MTAAPKKRKATQSTGFIAAVGAFIAAGVGLLGYLMAWSPSTYPLVLAFVGAGLAVWRSGLGLPPDERGYTRVEVIGSLLLGIVSLAVFVVALSLITACGHSFTGDKSSMRVTPYGTDGAVVVLHIDGTEVCKTTGTKTTLRVAPGVARRICAAQKGRCSWVEPAELKPVPPRTDTAAKPGGGS